MHDGCASYARFAIDDYKLMLLDHGAHRCIVITLVELLADQVALALVTVVASLLVHTAARM